MNEIHWARGTSSARKREMKATGSFRSGTRFKLQKKKRERGKININKLLQKFNIGDRVRIIQEPAIQKGMPHPRFKNRVGTITRKQGEAYVVELSDMGKKKEAISRSIHLVKAK